MNHLYYLEDIVFVKFFTTGTKQKQGVLLQNIIQGASGIEKTGPVTCIQFMMN